ncbi:hypothetical protein HNQ60_002441 [Povalibacter uvarum]|uniref:Uncharacterized protein n=1 Tax=Povalibacter uvarum TaxID=732238 RepID=A0A841HMR1_9GAMM|nr:DUF3187 family protein [Povalibacter uvarum]MBB6093560.1 hypothetical protein [Povalibacter uvarum]
MASFDACPTSHPLRRHIRLLLITAFSAATITAPALSQEVTERVEDASGKEVEIEQAWSHTGLLRARDLTPFGLLRLDMLPAHTADAKEGTWTFEIQLAYQNTFIMSENVQDYLERRNVGREPLRPQDAAAILALPGDAYYVDGEVGLADLIVQRRMNEYWSAYLTVPYIHYGEGVMDNTVEWFHDATGFSQQGRDLVARNRFQFIYDIGGTAFAQLDRSTKGGFGDPVFGIRYSLPEPRFGWDLVVELAAKIAVDGERFLLSTGENDYGAQLTMQRRFGATGRHAVYLSGSAVYYAGGPEIPGDESEVIPTLIAGYSVGITPTTSFILQAYASRSVVQDTSIDELRDDKYQLSLGLQSRTKNILWSFALTENISNFSNTPDFGGQIGIAYMPKAK